MGKPIKGRDGKFQGSIGEGKSKVPTPAPRVASVGQEESTSAPSYADQFNGMKAAVAKPTRVEDGVTWSEERKELRSDGWTIIDETTTGTYTGLKGEGYSGVQPEMAVEVRRTQWIRPDGSLSNESFACSTGGALLAIGDPENDLRLDGSTRPLPKKRVVTSFITAGASFKIFRHNNPDGSGYTWSADGKLLDPTDSKSTLHVSDIWTGPNGPSEKDLQDAVQRYREALR